MHETPKGADPQQQSLDADRAKEPKLAQGREGGSNAAAGGAGNASGMEEDEESGAGYGNNAGPQGG